MAIPEVVKQILPTQSPLLLLDTCSILDILRLTGLYAQPGLFRPQWDGIRKVCELAAGRDASLNIALAPQVAVEFDRHYPGELGRLAKRAAATLSFLDVVSYARGTDSPSSLQDADSWVSPFTGLVGQLMDLSLQMEIDQTCKSKGQDRSYEKIAPSAKQPQVDDCIIYEHYLACSRQLRASGYKQRILYLTSNTGDYMQGGKPHPPIDQELRELEIDLVLNWAWAARLL